MYNPGNNPDIFQGMPSDTLEDDELWSYLSNGFTPMVQGLQESFVPGYVPPWTINACPTCSKPLADVPFKLDSNPGSGFSLSSQVSSGLSQAFSASNATEVGSFASSTILTAPDEDLLHSKKQRLEAERSPRLKVACRDESCAASFTSNKDKRRHETTVHPGGQLYKCADARCDQWFNRKDNRDRHMKTCKRWKLTEGRFGGAYGGS